MGNVFKSSVKTDNAAATATASTSKKSTLKDEKLAKRFLEHAQWLHEQQSEEKEGEEGMIDDTSAAVSSAKKSVDEYMADPNNPVKYIDAVDGHITLASASITQFEGVTRKAGTYGRYIEIIKDLDLDLEQDEKHGETVLQLIDLYGRESKLLHDTSIAMIKLKEKAECTKDAIDLWKNKLSDGKGLTEKQFKIVEESLQEWFKDEEEIKDLHDKWGKFYTDAQKFNISFNKCTLDMLGQKFQEEWDKYSATIKALLVAGTVVMAASAATYVSVGCFAGAFGAAGLHAGLFFSTVAVTAGALTGIFIGGVVLLAGAVFAGYYARKQWQKRKKAEEDIKNIGESSMRFADSLVKDLSYMVKCSQEIRDAIGKLHQIMANNSKSDKKIKSFFEMCDDYEDTEGLRKKLQGVSNSLKDFSQQCVVIIGKVAKRQGY